MNRLVAAVAGVAVLFAALFAAGCSSSTSGGGEGAASTPPVSTPVSTPASTPVSSAVPSASESAVGTAGLSQQAAQDALIVAVDVGTGFKQTTSSDSSDPLPCTPEDPPLDQQFAPTAKALVDFANTAGSALVSEEITTYADAATAQTALAAGENGFACKSATIATDNGKIAVTISDPTDLTSSISVTVDKCEGWQISAQTANLVVIVARMGPQIVAMTFTAAPTVNPATLPDSRAITGAALKKVAAAL
jgi:hypothetical protein